MSIRYSQELALQLQELEQLYVQHFMNCNSEAANAVWRQIRWLQAGRPAEAHAGEGKCAPLPGTAVHGSAQH